MTMWIKTDLGVLYNCDKFDLIAVEEDNVMNTFYVAGFVGGVSKPLSDMGMSKEDAEELRDDIYDALESGDTGFDIANA